MPMLSASHTVGSPAGEGRRVISNIIRGSLGNLVEYYDWFAYASFSVFFAHAFFPAGSHTLQLLSTAAVFAVGFLTRPVGAYVLGRYADRYGRKSALTLSVLVMAVGSLLIGCTPAYATIGVAAPIILVVARLVQGLSVGGEYGASATYMSEVATSGRRGFFSSFLYVSVILGQLAALVVQLLLLQLLSDDDMRQWGWRIPFVIGAVAALSILIIRRGMDESQQYADERAAARESDVARAAEGSLRTLLRYWPKVAIVIGLGAGGTVAFYTYTTYVQKYLINTAGIGKESAAWINFASLLVLVCLLPAFGALSDRIGRRNVMLIFGVGATIIPVPLLTMLGKTKSPWAAFGLIAMAMVVLAPYGALNAIVKAEQFPTNVRALGVALPQSLTAALLGGTVETVALSLKHVGHERLFFYYVSAAAVITLITAYCMTDTRTDSYLDPAEGN